MLGGDEVSALVGDLGERSFKFGFGGEADPKGLIPSVAARGGSGFVAGDLGRLDVCGKDEIVSARKNGKVNSWNAVETLWDFAFQKHLHSRLEEHPVIASCATYEPDQDKEKLAELLFEKFHVPALYMPRNAMLSAFSVGRATAMIVDVGAAKTTCCAVNDGFVLNKTLKTTNVAGNYVEEHLIHLIESKLLPEIDPVKKELLPRCLVKRTPSPDEDSPPLISKVSDKERNKLHPTFIGWKKLLLASEIRKNVCRVWGDLILDPEKANKYEKQKYELPDGTMVEFGVDRFLSAELLMHPKRDEAFFQKLSAAHALGEQEFTSLPDLLRNSLLNAHGKACFAVV